MKRLLGLALVLVAIIAVGRGLRPTHTADAAGLPCGTLFGGPCTPTPTPGAVQTATPTPPPPTATPTPEPTPFIGIPTVIPTAVPTCVPKETVYIDVTFNPGVTMPAWGGAGLLRVPNGELVYGRMVDGTTGIRRWFVLSEVPAPAGAK